MLCSEKRGYAWNMQLFLDHAGVVGGPESSLSEQWRRLGFSVTNPHELLGSAEQGHAALGQTSCHAVLGQGYIELSRVYSLDPAHHLSSYLRRGAGLHILALGTQDIDAARREFANAGVPCSAIAWASRNISYGERHGMARFQWFMVSPDAAPEGLLCVVRNHTAELVYQPQVMTHPNSAVALRGMVIACHDVSKAALRYQGLLGVAPQSLGEDQCLILQGGQILLREISVCAELHGTDAQAAQDRYAALLVAVRDMSQTRAWLQSQHVPFTTHGDALQLSAAHGGGAALVFVPQ